MIFNQLQPFSRSILLGLIALVVFSNCANVGSLKGSARDTQPPRLVEKKTTPNLQRNFKKQRIELTFNEWVKLEDVFNQVVVSPPVNEQPEVTLDGRTVRFEFAKDEVLRENATYTINFGSAVKDLNEGNVADNLRFVFSTGAVLDSLTVKGRVVDALTGEPTEGVLFMLFDNLADSAVRKSKPFYFARTNKQGDATIENVREGTFKVFALVDKDLNYQFNQDIEKIGFPDSLLTITAKANAPSLFRLDSTLMKKDSIAKKKQENLPNSKEKTDKSNFQNQKSGLNTPLSIRLFDPVKKLSISNKETDKYGVAKLVFNQDIGQIPVKIATDATVQKPIFETVKDTFFVWYDLPSGDATWSVFAETQDLKGAFKTDTIRVRTRNRADFLKKNKLITTFEAKNISKHPARPIILPFNYPIQNFDTNRINLFDTLSKKLPLSIRPDSASPRKLRFDATWKEGTPYKLQILPSALTDIYGQKNQDTVLLDIQVQKRENFGDILLTVTDLDSTKKYLIEVLGSSGKAEASFYVENQTNLKRKIETVQPESYTLKVVEDTNGNRRWDTGDYDKKIQPERIFTKTIEGLRQNWELETEFSLLKTGKNEQ